MPAFRYEAASAAGAIERGVVDADSPKQARGVLRERGLTPIEVSPVQQAAPVRAAVGGRLRTPELALATRQLASLLSARVPLEQALSAVIEQAERPLMRERFAAVRSEVIAGQTLAQALEQFPRDFPDVYRALVGAGEQSGDLARVIERLADYVESRSALVQKIGMAFIYPGIVTVVAFAVVLALLAFVVPQVVGVFAQTRQKLPLLTVALIATSDFLRAWGGWLLVGIVALIAAWRLMMRAPTFRLEWDRRMLSLPLFGRLIRGMNTARFASTLSILAGSGVPLIRSLETAGHTLGNAALKADVVDAIARVREGAPLARALAANRRFPPMMIQLIASGESTGNLAEMLDRSAVTLAQETERRALTLTGLLEPLLILFMGGVVLLIVLAVLLPIIEINQLVR